jgi:hypothetical protein
LTQNGYLSASANEENFVVVKGEENTTLRTYEFAKGFIAHKVESLSSPTRDIHNS